MEHEEFMKRAIGLARATPSHPFGAVIVDVSRGSVMAEGANQSTVNATWHGEIVAINQFFANGVHPASDCLLYTTAEPCPMCQSAILWAGFRGVVFGTSIEYLAQTGWQQIGISSREICERTPFAKCHIMGGVMERECNSLFDFARSRQAGGQA